MVGIEAPPAKSRRTLKKINKVPTSRLCLLQSRCDARVMRENDRSGFTIQGNLVDLSRFHRRMNDMSCSPWWIVTACVLGSSS